MGGAFGVVTMPFSVREGINIFLSGFLPTENMRFRDFELNFKVTDAVEEDEGNESEKKKDEKKENEKEKKKEKWRKKEEEKQEENKNDDIAPLKTMDADYYRLSKGAYRYPTMTKTLGSFNLTVECGWFRDSEIVVMLGENGTGKTTFVKMLAGLLKPDDESQGVPELKVSYKPQ